MNGQRTAQDVRHSFVIIRDDRVKTDGRHAMSIYTKITNRNIHKDFSFFSHLVCLLLFDIIGPSRPLDRIRVYIVAFETRIGLERLARSRSFLDIRINEKMKKKHLRSPYRQITLVFSSFSVLCDARSFVSSSIEQKSKNLSER